MTAYPLEQFDTSGFAIVEDVVESKAIDGLCRQLTNLAGRDDESVRRKSAVFGVRNLLDLVPTARQLCTDSAIRSIAETILGEDCFAIRATLFNKGKGANWRLGWHRDKFIAVKRHVPNAVGFHAWSQKAGVWHVQPPVGVLENMLAVRIHLDDCPSENGALRVIPGTFDRQAAVDRTAAVACEVSAGGVLAMRPLLMHASSAATVPGQRRVIHIEYATSDLPGGVEWYDRIR